MRIKPQGVSSNKRFGLIYSSKDDLMHAISKLQCMYVQFYVVTKSSLHIPWVHSFGMTHLMISDTEITQITCIKESDEFSQGNYLLVPLMHMDLNNPGSLRIPEALLGAGVPCRPSEF